MHGQPNQDACTPEISHIVNQVWKLAWAQMEETGTKALKSNALLQGANECEVAIAETPFDVVFKIDKLRLMRYRPVAKPNPNIPPLLICYGLVGRQTMIDLQEDRSLVQRLLRAGLDVYVIDWGNPTRADQYLNFDDYIDDYLLSCVEFVRSANNNLPISLFGICEGGTLATALVALRPDLFAGLALAITPIDFHGDSNCFRAGEGYLNSWIANMSEKNIDLLIDAYGMLPGVLIGAVFSSLTPIASMTKYNLGLEALGSNDDATLNFLRMEKWLADRPDHPGEAARQLLNQLYRDNQLVKGEFEVGGNRVNLTNISCPVLNIYAEQDHIIPTSCTKALAKFIPSNLYEEIGFNGGHVGVFVSKKAQGVVADGIIDWAKRVTVKKMPA